MDMTTGTSDTITALRALLGDDQVCTEPAKLAEVASDSLRRSRVSDSPAPAAMPPLAIVRPRETNDVATVVRLAGERRLPLVELGGGTGLMGGARPIFARGLVMDMQSLDKILDLNLEDRTARAQAGVVLEDLDRALAEIGMMLGHDPWTVPIATVGGTISTNGLGYRGARYGSMGDQVLGLEVVLGDGSIVRTRPTPRSSTGPRLRHLFIGAEGTMGVITEATLRVFPLPERRVLHALEFPDFDSGFHAVEAMFAIGLVPAMVDFGQTYAGSRQEPGLFSPEGAKGSLQLAFEGFAEEVEAADRRAIEICARYNAVLRPQAEADEFWKDRHVIAERLRERRRNDEQDSWLPEGVRFDFIHVALAASRVLPFRDRAAVLMAERDVSVVEWGLWNQPELFSVVLQEHVKDEAQAQSFARAVDELLRLVQDMGGSMEYCHGAGLRLASLMEREHGRGLDLMRGVKAVVDPQGVLNPGKLDLVPGPKEA